jgi:hypothetical protein
MYSCMYSSHDLEKDESFKLLILQKQRDTPMCHRTSCSEREGSNRKRMLPPLSVGAGFRPRWSNPEGLTHLFALTSHLGLNHILPSAFPHGYRLYSLHIRCSFSEDWPSQADYHSISRNQGYNSFISQRLNWDTCWFAHKKVEPVNIT